MDLVTVYVTAPTREVARTLAIAALDAKLAACTNILECESIFEWEGTREQTKEFVLLMKTTSNAADALVELVGSKHPYDVPCIEVIPVSGAHAGYAAWVAQSVSVRP